ncbi:MAG: Asp-tRNA(Asn)/Glu-tRNA(Gln) amidotransferase GatCAB subunit A [Mycoplasma sp.]|nr:Asp-tRNA(Asn)/Glu-tRNA(Gln) amidotransferase GatCAB subunit A [Candidatus Hennigella equi]
MKSIILDLHEQLKSGKVSPQQLVDNAKALADKYAFTNSIITPIFKANDKFDPNNLLSCIPYSLKDNVSTEGIITTGGSKFLSNYIPPYNASVYGLLKNAGASLVCKDAMDEFGLGGTGTHCFTGPVYNPLDKTRRTGGSSSGSVVNVQTGISAFAIATDTGDSIRRPASLVGVVGYKPTYGAISRYGVLPYAPSFDHVGIVTKYVTDAVIVAEKVIKHDPKDYTSSTMLNNVKLDNLKEEGVIRFVILTNLVEMLDQDKQVAFNALVEKLRQKGHIIVEAELDKKVLDELAFAYKVLTFSEGYSCYSNLQGITFGKNDGTDNDDYDQTLIKSRTNNIGDEVKRRFVIGTFLTSKKNMASITLAARSIRHMAQDEQLRLLKMGDCILMPTLMSVAQVMNDFSKQSNYDDWLMLDNFSGTPSITIPFTKINNLPYGLTISCDINQDMKMLNIAYTLEKMLGGSHE